MTQIKIHHVDTNVSPSTFKDFDHILISDTFTTLQGEGPDVGTPCVFMRLAGCNRGAKALGSMGCEFCDTDFRMRLAAHYDCAEFAESMWHKLWDGKYLKMLVVSGGEPFLQWDKVVRVFEYLAVKAGSVARQTLTVNVETNGDYVRLEPLSKLNKIEHLWVNVIISPKIGGNTALPVEGKPDVYDVTYGLNAAYILPKLLKDLGKPITDKAMLPTRWTATLKMLISAQGPYSRVPEWAEEWNTHPFLGDVYLSPIFERVAEPQDNRSSVFDGSIDVPKLRANSQYAYRLCLQHGFKMSIQVQNVAEYK